jgi:hypothetical protein
MVDRHRGEILSVEKVKTIRAALEGQPGAAVPTGIFFVREAQLL